MREALARIASAPPTGCICSVGWGLRVGGLSSAVPHPSASPASQAVLRGQQASCILPLRRQVWDSLGGGGITPTSSPWQRLETKASLNKDPLKPSLSPGAFL